MTTALPAILETIWDVPAYLPYVQDLIDDDGIRRVEERLGLRLPRSYRAMIMRQNGGYIRYRLQDNVHSVISGVGEHYPTILNHSWEDYESDLLTSAGSRLLPFDGDGHWYLCLDYTEQRTEPCITQVETESDEPSLHLVAPTFDHYLAMLSRDTTGMDVKVIGEADPVKLIQELGQELALQVDPEPDTFAYGYPAYRAGGKRGGENCWVWCSSNRVQRGFVREQDYVRDKSRFDGLRQRFAGHALRYFENPAVSVLVSCTDNVIEEVLTAVRNHGYSFVS